MSDRQWEMTDTKWAVLIGGAYLLFIILTIGILVATDGSRHARNQCEDTTTHRYLLANYSYDEAVRLAELEC